MRLRYHAMFCWQETQPQYFFIGLFLWIIVKEGPQKLVKGGDVLLVGNLRSLVGNGSQVSVAHADHDDGSREAVAVQRNHVDFVVTQGSASCFLCLDQHVVI